MNVDTALRDLTGEGGHRDPLLLLAEMAQFPNRQPVGPAAPPEPHEARAKNEFRLSADPAPPDARKRRLRVILACVMIGMGILHFAAPAPFVRIMPSALPAPLVLVLVSGFFEALGGIGLLVPRARRAASFGLVLLYLAVFPANVNLVLHPENQRRLRHSRVVALGEVAAASRAHCVGSLGGSGQRTGASSS